MREKISQVKKILGFKNSPEYEKNISEVKNTLGSKIFWKKYFFGIWKKSLASLKNFLASLKKWTVILFGGRGVLPSILGHHETTYR